MAFVIWMSTGDVGNEAVRQAAADKHAEENRHNTGKVPAFLVKVRSSTEQSVEVTIKITGHTRATRQSDIKSEVAGRIESLTATEGATVSKGDVLLKLSKDTRPSAYRAALAGLKSSEKNYQSIRKLSGSGFQSELELLQARLALEQANQTLAQAKKALDDTTIAAPYGGVVETTRVEIGDLVSPGQNLLRLIDLDPIDVVTYVSEHELSRLKIGQRGRVTLVDGTRHEGTISFIAPSSDTGTGTFETRISLPNPNLTLLQGISADVVLFTERVNAHFMPKSALTLNTAGTIGVKAVSPTSEVVFYPAEIIKDTYDGVYLSGLPSLLELIVDGQDFVKSGSTVRVEKIG